MGGVSFDVCLSTANSFYLHVWKPWRYCPAFTYLTFAPLLAYRETKWGQTKTMGLAVCESVAISDSSQLACIRGLRTSSPARRQSQRRRSSRFVHGIFCERLH